MPEARLRRWIADVHAGRLPRRDFLQRLAALGLAPPVAATLLGETAHAQAAAPFVYSPTKRGGGGLLRVLLWQGPTQLNPHFATGTKDADGARVFYESLARWDGNGELQPVLAAQIPSRANGGVAADGRSVLWQLKTGVSWHDGQPFTADDVLFNAAYTSDPATAATTGGNFRDIRFIKEGSHSVRVVFDKPTPFWASPYAVSSLIPRHLFAPYAGAKSRDAPANLKPVGTGPYRFAEFKPGDMLRGTLNPNYHAPNRPHFDAIEIKGGGDATSAARAVLQAGEFDFGYPQGGGQAGRARGPAGRRRRLDRRVCAQAGQRGAVPAAGRRAGADAERTRRDAHRDLRPACAECAAPRVARARRSL